MSDYYEEVADMMLSSVACRHVPREVLLRKLRAMSEPELRAKITGFMAEAERFVAAHPGMTGIVYNQADLEEAYAKQRSMK